MSDDDDDNHGEVASPQQSKRVKRGFLKRLLEDTGSESGDVPRSPSTSIPPTPLPISSGTPMTPGTPATPMTSEKLVPQPATLETGLGPAKQRRTAGPPSLGPSHAQPAASAASAGGDPPRFGAEASAKAAAKVGVEWRARRLHQALSASGVIQRLQNQKCSTPLLLEEICAGTSPVHIGLEARPAAAPLAALGLSAEMGGGGRSGRRRVDGEYYCQFVSSLRVGAFASCRHSRESEGFGSPGLFLVSRIGEVLSGESVRLLSSSCFLLSLFPCLRLDPPSPPPPPSSFVLCPLSVPSPAPALAPALSPFLASLGASAAPVRRRSRARRPLASSSASTRRPWGSPRRRRPPGSSCATTSARSSSTCTPTTRHS